MKQWNNGTHSTIKITPSQDSLKEKKGYVYKILLYKRKKIKAKFQLGNLVRTAYFIRTFAKRDTINWSYKVYKITEIINDPIPSYLIDNLPERYKEPLLN